MRINYNAQAMRANLALNKADDRVSQSIGRLSSGLKISAAKDSPSGYAISKRMNLQIEGLDRANQSSNDAISVINIADGALQEVSDMIQRMSELAVKAANGTMMDKDRELCQQEIEQLKSEIKRVASTTQFNGQTLMDGSFDLKGYTNNLNIKVATYSDDTAIDKYEINSLNITYNKDGEIDADLTKAANEPLDATGFPAGAAISKVDGNLVTIEADNGFSVTLAIDPSFANPNTTIDAVTKTSTIDGKAYTPSAPLIIDITGLGAMDMQIGANEDQIISIRIPELSLQLMSIDDLDVSTEASASKGISDLDIAMDYLNDMRSRLGAYQNRLEHTIGTLNVTSEAMTSAYSGLVDADMAEETVTYTTQQVISQAATSVLAQANDRPSQALQLLQ